MSSVLSPIMTKPRRASSASIRSADALFSSEITSCVWITDSSLVAKRSDITYEAIPIPTKIANTTAKAVLYDFGERVHINCAPEREEELYHTVDSRGPVFAARAGMPLSAIRQ